MGVIYGGGVSQRKREVPSRTRVNTCGHKQLQGREFIHISRKQKGKKQIRSEVPDMPRDMLLYTNSNMPKSFDHGDSKTVTSCPTRHSLIWGFMG